MGIEVQFCDTACRQLFTHEIDLIRPSNIFVNYALLEISFLNINSKKFKLSDFLYLSHIIDGPKIISLKEIIVI